MSSLRSVALAAPFGADIVAKRFCASEQATLIQDPASVCNVDSKIHSSRFDFCGFYSQTAARRLLQQNLPLGNPDQLYYQSAAPSNRSDFPSHSIISSLRAAGTTPGLLASPRHSRRLHRACRRISRMPLRCIFFATPSGGYKEALKSYGSTPQLVDPVIRDVPRLENQPERVRAGLQAPAWPQGLLLERQKGCTAGWRDRELGRFDAYIYSMGKLHFDRTDYSIVVKNRAPLPNSWRWEIYRAGRSSPIEQSSVYFHSVATANRAGKEALRQLLDKLKV